MHKVDSLSTVRMKYPDRATAAEELTAMFEGQLKAAHMVLAIPRGGVVTGKVMADRLNLPMDLLLCKKIGHPENKEYAIGSVCADGTRILTDNTSDYHKDHFERQCHQMETWLKSRYLTLTGRNHPAYLKNKTVIITDDGLATGSTMLAAIRSVRTSGARCVIVATPVASKEAAAEIKRSADEFLCPLIPQEFHAVGQFYHTFEPVTDEQVREITMASTNVKG